MQPTAGGVTLAARRSTRPATARPRLTRDLLGVSLEESMNWTALAAVGQVAGAAAVFVTLLYLARQVALSNLQADLDAYRQTMGSLDAWQRSIYESEELTDLVVRGRRSYESLGETERIRFANLHHSLLNIAQLEYDYLQQLPSRDRFRQLSEKRLGSVVRGYMNHPGVLKFWEGAHWAYGPGLCRLVSENTGDA